MHGATDSLSIEHRDPASLKPFDRNSRTHSDEQIKQIANSIKEFGFVNPILISPEGEIIAGHGRLEAAKLLQLTSVPTITLGHLSEAQRRALVISDNKIAENAGWNFEILKLELDSLAIEGFDLTITGFSIGELGDIFDPEEFGAEEYGGEDEPKPKTTTCPECGAHFVPPRRKRNG